MEEGIRSRLIQAIEYELAACERDISALAHEALSPATSSARRAEALIRRAEMQTRTISLARQLLRLQFESESLDCADRCADASGLHECATPERGRSKWLWTNELFRAS